MEKPTLKQRADAFVKFLWDSENSKVLGRGGRSWVEIGLFYLIYYACLASFFAATVAVFYQTIEDDRPKLLSDSSLIKGNPGMGFRPIPTLEDLKIVSSKIPKKNKAYVKSMKDFLKPYEEIRETVDCTDDQPRPGYDTACKVDLAKIKAACPESKAFGMADGTPCILLKLNKVFDWIPKLWDATEDNGLPEDVKAVYNDTVIPVKCYARDEDDREDLGAIEYIPQQGFPVQYYPYMKQKDYLSPLVFVQFKNATVDKTFKIICRAYAKNIEYDRQEIQGSTEFELKVSAD